MAVYVGQRFLHQAENGDFKIARKPAELFGYIQRDVEAAALF